MDDLEDDIKSMEEDEDIQKVYLVELKDHLGVTFLKYTTKFKVLKSQLSKMFQCDVKITEQIEFII